ncbi:MAG: hypothetical protein ABL899_01220 [Nitrospira sp.]
MSILPFFEEKQEEVSLLIDIGNGSIGGAFVLWKKGKIPNILYNVRLPFVITEDTDSSKLIQGMDALLEQILDLIMDKGFTADFWKKRQKKLASILVSFSAPWFASRTKNIHIVEEKPFTVTSAFLDSIMDKEEILFKDELKKISPESSFVVIEKSIVHTKINGYALDQSVGKKTKILDLSICLSVVAKNIVEKVDKTVSKHINIPKEKIFFHSFPLISFTVLRDMFPGISDFIMIDATSEIVEMTVVRDGVIDETVSFPYGRNFVVREIARTLNVPNEVALSTLHMYNENKANDLTVNNVQDVLVNIEKKWSEGLDKAFGQLIDKTSIPKRAYITADADVAGVFMDFLKLPKGDSTSDFRKNLSVVHLNHDRLSDLYETNPTNKQDEFVALLSIFYNKMRNQVF